MIKSVNKLPCSPPGYRQRGAWRRPWFSLSREGADIGDKHTHWLNTEKYRLKHSRNHIPCMPAKGMQVIRFTPGISPKILNFNTFYSYLRLLQRSMSFSSTGSCFPNLENSSPPTPRPSASLVLVNERNEILLVRRNPKAVAFGGMHVRLSVRGQSFAEDADRCSQEETLTRNKTTLSP